MPDLSRPAPDPDEPERTEVRIDDEILDSVKGCTSLADLGDRGRARVAGRIRSVTVQPWGSTPTLECDLTEHGQHLTVAFLGRRQIAGLEPGSRVVVDGTVGTRRGQRVMINPEYELLARPDGQG